MSDKKKFDLAELRTKIDALIAIDIRYQSEQAKKYPDGIMISFENPQSDTSFKDIFQGEQSQVMTILEELSTDELAYVMALMWFGRGDGEAEPGATFESFLDYAKKEIDEMSVSYIAAKPLGSYLSKGLMRLEKGEY